MSQNLPWGDRSPAIALLPFLGIAAVYAAGLQMDLMDVDAAQYAAISREMVDTDSWLQVHDRGGNYLDKPPLLFWLSGLSMKLFGFSNWAYRLPSMLMSWAAGWAVLRYASHYYGQVAGYVAALLLLSCQAFFLINHDVRTDTLLAASVALGIWKADEYVRTRRLSAAFMTGVFLAMALLAKGPIGLLAPAMALLPDWALRRPAATDTRYPYPFSFWRNLFLPGWLLTLAVMAALLVPMCLGLYQQHGSHGLYFFFWLQSFGRITGENSWSNNPDPFFLVHNSFWALLPYTLFFWIAQIRGVRDLFRRGSRPEYATITGFLLPILALSLSKYQLPHYAFVSFPMGAVAAAAFLSQLTENISTARTTYTAIHVVIAWLLLGVLSLLVTVCFPMDNALAWIPFALGAIGLLIITLQKSDWKLLWAPFVAGLVTNFYLNIWVYPSLLLYQSPSVVADYVKAQGLHYDKVVTYGLHAYSLDFGLRRIVPHLDSTNQLTAFIQQNEGRAYVYMDTAQVNNLKAAGLRIKPLVEMGHFHITMLTLAFLNPKTRAGTLRRQVFAEVRH